MYRLLIHTPPGAFLSWLVMERPLLGAIFAVFLLAYQLNEDWSLRDGAFRDISGYLWGSAIAALVLILT